jgi:hypothetical protein
MVIGQHYPQRFFGGAGMFRPSNLAYVSALSLTKLAKERADIADQQVGRVLGGMVTATVIDVPRDDVL